MNDNLLKYFNEKDAELQQAVNNSYPAKNKVSSKDAHHERHADSLFATNLITNKKDFGTNYKIED